MADSFKALEVDENDVLLGIVSFRADEYPLGGKPLPPRYIDLRPHGGDCDRAPGAYRWNRELGTLEPLKSTARRPKGGVSLEQALTDFLKGCERGGVTLPASTAAWLKQQEGN